MKTKLFTFLTIIIILLQSCKDTKNESNLKVKEIPIEFSRTFLDAKDLVLSKDTLKKSIKFKFRNYEIPLNVSLLSGLDKESCNRIVYLKIVKDEKFVSKVNVSNLDAQLVPCAMEFENGETIDTTKYEAAVISLELKVKEGIKKYDFKGSIGNITSLGVYKSH